MKPFTCFIFSFLHLAAYCQPNNYKCYYQFTNRAEIAAMSEDFLQASRYYDSAFKEVVKIPCANDIYNSLICDLHLKNRQKADRKVRLLVSLGMDTGRLTTLKVPVMVRYFKSVQGKLLLKDVKAGNIRRLPSIDTMLQNRIKRLIEIDQKYRLMEGGYTLCRDSINAADRYTATEMLKIIKEKNGLPSLYDIGINGTELARPAYYILLFHQFAGMFGTVYDFSSEILRAVRDGCMHPEVAAYLLERSNPTYKLGNVVYLQLILDSTNTYKSNDGKLYPSCFVMREKLTEASIADYNFVRQAIYLDDMHSHLRKIHYLQFDEGRSGIAILKTNTTEIMCWLNRKDFEYACSKLNQQ